MLNSRIEGSTVEADRLVAKSIARILAAHEANQKLAEWLCCSPAFRLDCEAYFKALMHRMLARRGIQT